MSLRRGGKVSEESISTYIIQKSPEIGPKCNLLKQCSSLSYNNLSILCELSESLSDDHFA